MAFIDIDSRVTIYSLVPTELKIGAYSKYASSPHPATSNKIEGWEYNIRRWQVQNEFRSINYVSPVKTAETLNPDASLFQSGIGTGEDLLLVRLKEIISNSRSKLIPQINHGDFYIQNSKWYLYSDSYFSEYFNFSTLSLTLKSSPKSIVPITVRQYVYDKVESVFSVYLDYRKKVSFTPGSQDPEFKIDYTTSPPILSLNNDYSFAIGAFITVPSTAVSIDNLELLGSSTGVINQKFQTSFSPLSSLPIESQLWVYPSDKTLGVEWTLVQDLAQPLNANEAWLDIDHGIVNFGTNIPPAGNQISIFYKTAVAVHYEPLNTNDYLLAEGASTAVGEATSEVGFISISTTKIKPAQITLATSNLSLDPNLVDTYSISFGNNVGLLEALVVDKIGDPIEGARVEFNISSAVGGFVGASSTVISVITNKNGVAKTSYHSPSDIVEMGGVMEYSNTAYDLITDKTILSLPSLDLSTNMKDYILYRIDDDTTNGIINTDLTSYYTSYFTDVGILDSTNLQAYEEFYRSSKNLLKPTSYSSLLDLTTGRKSIYVALNGANIIDPNTGEASIGLTYSPVYPLNASQVGENIELVYSGDLRELPAPPKSWIVYSSKKISISARVTETDNSIIVSSNNLKLSVALNGSINGSYISQDLSALPTGLLNKVNDFTSLLASATDLNDLNTIYVTSGLFPIWESLYLSEKITGLETYSEWIIRTRASDSNGRNSAAIAYGIPFLEGTSTIDTSTLIGSGEIPIGWRVKTSGISIASLIDRVTFFTPNDNITY